MVLFSFRYIECFHSRGQHLCKFIATKESVCIRKEFNSQRTGLGHQHGRRDVMWKHSVGTNLRRLSSTFQVRWEPLIYNTTKTIVNLLVQNNFMIDCIKSLFQVNKYTTWEQALAHFCWVVLTVSRIACWVECALQKPYWDGESISFCSIKDSILVHSRGDQFFEDPIKVGQQRNRPIVVCVSVILSFENRNNFCHF